LIGRGENLKNIKGKADDLGDVSHLFKRKAKETKEETKAISSKVFFLSQVKLGMILTRL
jgi:hypothetical protein